ncbi:STM4015 family protein [Yinghuangia sp. KLBMP8922]|uniref:STM4015 family protein n=2 Tax=Yinghuangia soli TaxID=2908204 RepID=A0AA41U108_9ACTN|nr:STM4015 family protein [Yinghuangia soli]
MAIWQYGDTWAGLPVHWLARPHDPARMTPQERNIWELGGGQQSTWAEVGAAAPDAAEVAWALSVTYARDLPFADLFAGFVEAVDTTRVRVLLLGYWATGLLSEEPPDHAIRVLCAHADRFPALRSLFVGAIASEEHEISWIPRGDVTPVLEAFPQLEELTYRFGQPVRPRGGAQVGGDGTGVLRPVRHARLRRLTLETGGLPAHVPAVVAACDFPALEHLDLWLGVSFYGGETTVDDLTDLLAARNLPRLRHLGLMNSEMQDEVAAAVAGAPVVAQLESLDLSMGSLGDAGAEALLAGQPLTHLRKLSLRHHFISDAMRTRLDAQIASAGVDIDLSDAMDLYEWLIADGAGDGRYVEVSE